MSMKLPMNALAASCSGFELWRAQICVVLVIQTVMDVQNRVRLVGTIGSEEGIEAGICLDVDKHAGEL